MKLSRRDFLQSASASFGIPLLDRISLSEDDLQNTFKEIRKNILEMINEERDVEKLQPVKLDDFATEVATKHAVDMVTNEFISHWGTDGLKPYHRYSVAGGTYATEENVSAVDGTWSTKAKDLKQDSAYLHLRLYQEKPPYDGHRQTILRPQHTHVGIGLALQSLRLRMVELFVAKYVEVEPIKREAKPNAQLSFSGKITRHDYSLHHVEVYYEPLPTPPELSWLRATGSYALPKDSKVLRPKVPPPQVYVDGIAGVVEIGKDGIFKTPVRLYKNKPGIYTVVVWIQGPITERAFPATAVCIKAQ